MILDYFNKDLALGVEMLIGTTFIFLVMILFVRIFGLKSLSKMTG